MSYHKGLEEIEQSVNKKNSLNTLYKKSARLNKLNYVLSQRIPQIELSLSSILKADTEDIQDLVSRIRRGVNDIKDVYLSPLEKVNLNNLSYEEQDSVHLHEDLQIKGVIETIKTKINEQIGKFSHIENENFKSLAFIIKDDDDLETIEVLNKCKNMISSLSSSIKSHKCVNLIPNDYYTLKAMISSKANEFKFDTQKELSFEYNQPQIEKHTFQMNLERLHDYQEDPSYNEEEEEENEKDSNDENIDESDLIRQYYEDTKVLSKETKYINSGNFNASRSNEQLLSVGHVEEYQQNYQPHRSPMNSEFIKDSFENEPIPEVLTSEIPSSKESTQIQLTKVQERRMSTPKIESHQNSVSESAKFINEVTSLDEEKETISKDAENMLILIDEFITDDLAKKQFDLINIENNISNSVDKFLQEVNNTFSSSTENII